MAGSGAVSLAGVSVLIVEDDDAARDLLTRVDDRYVIMNAGDELRLRFPQAPPPPEGFVRDFIVVADGWEKDGDYNTSFSRTVLPLPTHRTVAEVVGVEYRFNDVNQRNGRGVATGQLHRRLQSMS